MADVDGPTLVMAIQAVQSEIRRFEELLSSETLRDPADMQDLVVTFERAAEALKEAYLSEWTVGSNLPAYEKLVDDNRGGISAEVITFPKA